MPPKVQDYSAPFFEERARSKQQVSQEAAQASAIAEALGYYTPELQARAVRPLGQVPTKGEQMIGAPIRGLGKLMGSETMQQWGAEVPFDLGQAQPGAGFNMPQLPAGTSPEMAQQFNQIAASLGYGPAGERDTIPNVPSETSAVPRMKTQGQRKLEDELKGKVWDKILEQYQTKEQRAKAAAELEELKASSDYKRALATESRARAKRGPMMTEAQLIYDEAKERGMNPSAVAKLWKSNTATPNRTIQLYEYAKKNNMLPKNPDGTDQTVQEFTRGIKFAGGDMLKQLYRGFMESDAVYMIPPENWMQEIFNQYEQWGTLLEAYNQENKLKSEEKQDQKTLKRQGYLPLMEDMPIPDELLVQEVTEIDIQQLMEDEGISRMQAIEMYLDFLRQARDQRRGGTNATQQAGQ